jgi:hypothetical protein
MTALTERFGRKFIVQHMLSSTQQLTLSFNVHPLSTIRYSAHSIIHNKKKLKM